MKVTDAFKFPAIELFMERAAAGGSRLEPTDEDVATIAAICGRLDGIPLAIEFAAARVGLHGLAGTAELLKSRFGLQFPGRRTAVPRHQTLHALLDWSYGLLPESEQLVLRRLSAFVGPFDLEAAQAICRRRLGEAPQMIAALENLAAKPLVSVTDTSGIIAISASRRPLGCSHRSGFRESAEKQVVAQRHAKYFASVLSVGEPAAMSVHLGNMRAALEWVFGSARPTLMNFERWQWSWLPVPHPCCWSCRC